MPDYPKNERDRETRHEFVAGGDDDNRRLDRLVRRLFPNLPLSAVYRAIREGLVVLNGARADPASRVRTGDSIGIRKGFREIPSSRGATAKPRSSLEIAGLVLFEDGRLLFINKPAGIPVHGRGGLDSAVSAYLAPLLPPSLSFRPGPLHRLDRNTSGLLCFSKSIEGARFFTAALAGGSVRKEYLAVVDGKIAEGETWEDDLVRDPVRGVTSVATPRAASSAGAATRLGRAITSIEPVGHSGDLTLLRVFIRTGRTHQIRAQAGHRGFPLAGDRKYGSASLSPCREAPYLLHAAKIVFSHDDRYPDLPAEIAAPLPEYFASAVKELFGYPA